MGNTHTTQTKNPKKGITHESTSKTQLRSIIPTLQTIIPKKGASKERPLNSANLATSKRPDITLPQTASSCSTEAYVNVDAQKSPVQSPAERKFRRKRRIMAHSSKEAPGDMVAALEQEQKVPSKLRRGIMFHKKMDELDELKTAEEKPSTPKKIRRGISFHRKNDEPDELKTAKEPATRSKLRRFLTFHKKHGGLDSARTARETTNRSRHRMGLRMRLARNDQDSIKTAKERNHPISPRKSKIFSIPFKPSEGKNSCNREAEEKTQEQDSLRSAEKADREKAQNEVRAWVDRMLEKGVKGLRQEFSGLRVATIPTADKYQQFTVNAPFGRNRYRDVFCLDESRIVLRDHPTGNDYIHANYVSTPLMPNRFICAQAPKDETIYDFWLMILQERIEIVIMLGDFIEKERPKCAQYLPQEVNVIFAINDVNIECISKTMLTEFPCKMIRRTLIATRKGTKFTLTHYHWSGWPDHGVPNADYSPFRLLQLVRCTKRPICVHCSAGIGRTGSIVAIEYILERLKANEDCVDLVDIVKVLRKQRAGIVQTDLQYLYVHRVMLMYFTDMKLITESDRLQNFIHEYERLIPPFQ